MAVGPLMINAVAAILLVATIRWAFFGPPPDRRDVGTAKLWGLVAAVLYLAGIYALFAERPSAPFLVGLGVLALCVAFWYARGDDGGGGGGDSDDGDGPLDWDEFDRARRDWDRPLIGA